MIINKLTRQHLKNLIQSEKQALQDYKFNSNTLPINWTIKEQKTFIMGMTHILEEITRHQQNDNSL